MKTAAIMQPYFFPYIGYFQLMRAVDVFVIYDNVQYMKGSWINRNRILSRGQPAWITLPVKRANLSLNINQRNYCLGQENTVLIKSKLRESYSRAPFFDSVFPMVCELLDYPDTNVAKFNAHLLRTLASWMELDCDFQMSSNIDAEPAFKGQNRVIDICTRLSAGRYVNAIGGIELYDAATFSASGIELNFLCSNPAPYAQFENSHVPSLSIIDVLMFNPKSRLGSLMDCYQLTLPNDEGRV